MAFRTNVGRHDIDVGEVEELLHRCGQGSLEGKTLQFPPAKISGGDVLLYVGSSAKFIDHRSDSFLWRNCGNTKNGNCPVLKIVYRIQLSKSKYDTSSEFQRFVYTLKVVPSSYKYFPVLVHYTGDSSVSIPRPHGNAIHTKRKYMRTLPSTLHNMRQNIKCGHGGRKAYEEGIQDAEQRVDNANQRNDKFKNIEAFAAPRNYKQAKNIKLSVTTAARISCDELYNVYRMMKSEYGDVIQRFQLGPEFCVIFAHPGAIELANRLLQRGSKERVPQLCTYDTTFQLGDFYLSAVVLRNIELISDPIFPVMFMIHDRKLTDTHMLFWKFHVIRSLNIEKYGQNLPICVDRELAITNAIKAAIPNALDNLLFCQNHIVQDVKQWLRSHRTTSDDYNAIKRQIVELMECKSDKVFSEKYEACRNKWSHLFVKYADAHLRDDIRKHGLAGQRNLFAAFDNDKCSTNNLSESFNKMVKSTTEWKELPADTLIMVLYQMQCYFLNEFNRGYKDLGNYEVKEQYVNASELKLPGVRITTLEELVVNVRNGIVENQRAEVSSNFNMTRKAMAQSCNDNERIKFDKDFKVYLVSSPINDEVSVVNMKGKPKCSCKRPSCYHILAVQHFIGLMTDDDKRIFKLSEIRKKCRDGRSGRKQPRIKDQDLDVSIDEAPDSLLAKEKSGFGSPRSHSTPKPKKFISHDGKTDDEGVSDDILRKAGLLPGEWLEGDQINKAVDAIIKQSRMGDRVALFPSFYYNFLATRQRLNSVGLHIYRIEALNKDVVIVVMNTDNIKGIHWVTGVIIFASKMVFILDSLRMLSGDSLKKHFLNLAQLVQFAYQAAKVLLDLDEWKFVMSCDFPRQKNGSDCGLFPLFAAAAICRRTRTLPMRSRMARQWMFNLLNMEPDLHGNEVFTEDWFGQLSSEQVAAINITEGETEDKLALAVCDFSKDWTVCAKCDLCRGDHSMEQNMCCACHLWFHDCCHPMDKRDVYFVCTDCKM